ncbi:IS5 family transposase [Burkholderia sp. JSH-S8]|nr:IS5 family transposase [Burkholderia sp. JSH-S8]
MRRGRSKTHEPKARYRVRNWAAYNADLINRGNVMKWIDEAALTCTTDSKSRRGRSRLYSDALIQALPGLKTVFRLPLRALQGFVQSLRDLAFAALPVPNDTTLCRRTQTLEAQLPIVRDGEPIRLAVDSAGMKLYGEGEWQVRQHCGSKRRSWRKVHLALDAIARLGYRKWEKGSGYHRRSLAENATYRLKARTGNRLWCTDSQATEIVIRVGVQNHMVAMFAMIRVGRASVRLRASALALLKASRPADATAESATSGVDRG